MAIDLTNGHAELLEHVGHKISCVSYANGENVAIECETCGCVLVDFNELDEPEDN